MNRFRVTFLSAMLLFASAISGQDTPKTILWKVEKPNSNYRSYLFGTFHEVSPFFFDALPNAVSRLQQSDALFVEARTPDSKQQSIIEPLPWNSVQWKQHLTPEQALIFARFVNKAEDSSYYQLNPLLLTLTTSRLYLVNFCNSDSAFPGLMDSHIEKTAADLQKPVYSLDGDQHAMLNKEAANLGAEQDAAYLSYSIDFMRNMLENDLSGCQLVKDYKSFDLNYELEADISQNASYSSLLVERNRRWTGVLHHAFSTQNCFVAVGFRHLFYKQGLVQQLRSLGYVVTPVPAGK
ncbi:MAG: TraB/GumN family protein [Bacteroidota bacterium]